MQGNCPVCGAPLKGNSCEYCGYKGESEQVVASTSSQPNIIINNVQNNNSGVFRGRMISEKSRTVTLLLCIFLGYFGIHYFYVGKIGKGILYLFTCGLFGFGWVIDIFVIAFGKFRDQYNLLIQSW